MKLNLEKLEKLSFDTAGSLERIRPETFIDFTVGAAWLSGVF